MLLDFLERPFLTCSITRRGKVEERSNASLSVSVSVHGRVRRKRRLKVRCSSHQTCPSPALLYLCSNDHHLETAAIRRHVLHQSPIPHSNTCPFELPSFLHPSLSRSTNVHLGRLELLAITYHVYKWLCYSSKGQDLRRSWMAYWRISTRVRHTCRGGSFNFFSRTSVDRECHFRSTYQTCIFRSINHSTVQLIFSNRTRPSADTSWRVPLFPLCTVANHTRRSCPGRGAGISFLSWLPNSACLVWSRPSSRPPTYCLPFDRLTTR
jgi:hypothetical protein